MSKQKSDEELIKSIKKMNKTAREIFAQRAGFLNSTDYIGHLSGKSTKTKTTITTKIKTKVHNQKCEPKKSVVHVVDILDTSGSMSWGSRNDASTKIGAALQAINSGVKELIKEKLVTYTYSLTTFSTSTDINFVIQQKYPKDVPHITAKADGGTALYDAIGLTLKSLAYIKEKEDKVLVNIYTDGEENSSINFKKKQVGDLIEKCQTEGFTVTFIGTIQDTERAITNLKIDKSNTLSYDGTAQGLSKSMMSTNSLRSSYANSVSKGEDVAIGFYKTLNEK